MLTERPPQYNFSKNEIRYVFHSNIAGRSSLRLQVRLKYAAIGNTDFTVLQQFELKPSSDGYTYLYIQTYLHSYLNYVMPLFGNTFTGADEQLLQFYIEHREVDSAHLNPAWLTNESDRIRIVLKGGIERNKNSRSNFFYNYLFVNKTFLTWQPDSRFIFKDEKAYISFLKADYAATGYQLKIKSVDINETESTNLVAIPDGHKLYHINVGPANLELADDLYYYEVSVIDSDNAYIVQPYRFYIEYRPIYSFFDLVYVNSLSGIDFVRAKGEFALTIERIYDESEGGLNVNDATSYVKPHESAQVAITGRKSYKGDIGFLRNKKQQEALNDVLYSTHIYMAVDERWVPLQNITKTQELGTTSDKNKSYPIEWTLSETNEVFTPEKILLGNHQYCYERRRHWRKCNHYIQFHSSGSNRYRLCNAGYQ